MKAYINLERPADEWSMPSVGPFGDWVTITYDTVRDENGETIGWWNTGCDCWHFEAAGDEHVTDFHIFYK